MNNSRVLTLVVLTIVSVGLMLSGASSAGEQHLSSLPQAVKEAVLHAYPQATIGSNERGHIALTVFEVEVRNGADQMELLVTQDGSIVQVEQRIYRNELPAAVAQTLDRAAGSAQVHEIARTERRAKLGFSALANPDVYYEAEWKRGAREIEIDIAQDGTLLGSEGEGDDDEDEDDDGDDH